MALSEYDKTHVKEILNGEGTWYTARLLRCLYELMSHADQQNTAKLLSAFPEETGLILNSLERND